MVDDNPVNTIEDMCNVRWKLDYVKMFLLLISLNRAKFLIEDMSAWLQQRWTLSDEMKVVRMVQKQLHV